MKLFRFLRRLNLDWLMPFWFAQDDYRNGVQTLIVYRWGRVSVERWDWGREYGYDHYEALLKKGATKSELYDRIKFSAVCISDNEHRSDNRCPVCDSPDIWWQEEGYQLPWHCKSCGAAFYRPIPRLKPRKALKTFRVE